MMMPKKRASLAAQMVKKLPAVWGDMSGSDWGAI